MKCAMLVVSDVFDRLAVRWVRPWCPPAPRRPAPKRRPSATWVSGSTTVTMLSLVGDEQRSTGGLAHARTADRAGGQGVESVPPSRVVDAHGVVVRTRRCSLPSGLMVTPTARCDPWSRCTLGLAVDDGERVALLVRRERCIGPRTTTGEPPDVGPPRRSGRGGGRVISRFASDACSHARPGRSPPCAIELCEDPVGVSRSAAGPCTIGACRPSTTSAGATGRSSRGRHERGPWSGRSHLNPAPVARPGGTAMTHVFRPASAPRLHAASARGQKSA